MTLRAPLAPARAARPCTRLSPLRARAPLAWPRPVSLSLFLVVWQLLSCRLLSRLSADSRWNGATPNNEPNWEWAGGRPRGLPPCTLGRAARLLLLRGPLGVVRNGVRLVFWAVGQASGVERAAVRALLLRRLLLSRVVCVDADFRLWVYLLSLSGRCAGAASGRGDALGGRRRALRWECGALDVDVG